MRVGHFADRVGSALREIGEAAYLIRRSDRDKNVLTIATLPSFAARCSCQGSGASWSAIRRLT